MIFRSHILKVPNCRLISFRIPLRARNRSSRVVFVRHPRLVLYKLLEKRVKCDGNDGSYGTDILNWPTDIETLFSKAGVLDTNESLMLHSNLMLPRGPQLADSMVSKSAKRRG